MPNNQKQDISKLVFVISATILVGGLVFGFGLYSGATRNTLWSELVMRTVTPPWLLPSRFMKICRCRPLPSRPFLTTLKESMVNEIPGCDTVTASDET